MSWVDDEGRHEGHVAELFGDGMAAAGWTGDGDGHALLIVEQLDEAGQLVGQETRSPADVVGWQVRCDCIPAWVSDDRLGTDGLRIVREQWAGRTWRLVSSPDREDLDAGRVYVAVDDPDGVDVESRPEVHAAMHEEWLRHAAPDGLAALIRRAVTDLADAGAALDDAVAHARRQGVSWEVIGRAASVTRQAAHERWRHLEDNPGRPPARVAAQAVRASRKGTR